MSEHEAGGDKPRDIGLKAVRDARVQRGANKHGRITGRAWLVAIMAVLTVVAVAWQFRERSLSVQKEELLAKQRAALTTVGAAWNPLRSTLEQAAMDAAGRYEGDFFDLEVQQWDFRSLPGIYLRMRVADAKNAAAIRKAADDSQRDSFVGCMFRENNPSMQRVTRGEDAGSGWQDQPWNLRLAYFATRILTDEWVSEVKSAEDEIHLRVFVQQYEKSKNEEIPLAIDIVKRAQFFLLALDEDVPEAAEHVTDAGRNAGKITERALQEVKHPTRVHVFQLERSAPGANPTLKERVRVRREGDADFRFAGEHTVTDPYTLSAMKRQVNNCALAQTVWAAIHPARETAPADAGAPDAAP